MPGHHDARPAYRGSPVAVAVVFAAAGIVSAAALARMPSIREHVGATSAELSLALVCVGIGSLAAMPRSGRVIERFSSGTVLRLAALVTVLGWALLAVVPSVATMAVCMLAIGAGTGVWDVAMNVQGHGVERRHGHVLMTTWHALFSFGALGGALLGAASAALGVPVGLQFPTASAITLAVVLWFTRYFVSDRVERRAVPATAANLASTPARPSAVLRGITRIEILLGLMVMATALGEGAANDWLALMLVDTRGVGEAFGGLTFGGFNLTMAFARLLGSRVLERYGRVKVLRASGATACFGIGLLCLMPSLVSALIGAACWGLGLAVVFPTGISAAGEVPGRGARAMALVSTIGYAGFLLGAPLIGQLTRVLSLDRVLLLWPRSCCSSCCSLPRPDDGRRDRRRLATQVPCIAADPSATVWTRRMPARIHW